MIPCSTISKIFDAELSANIFSTCTSIIPVKLIIPDKTLSPILALLGTDSPVNALVSRDVFPLIILPSSAIFSPAFTIIVSPIFIVSGLTLHSLPPRRTTA